MGISMGIDLSTRLRVRPVDLKPQYPFLEIPNLLPCKGRLVRSVRNFTRITNVEIGVIILQKIPLSLRLKFVGNLSNTPAFPLTTQKSCDFFMFEPNSYYVQIYCCSLRIIYSQIGCGYMYSAPVLNNSSSSSKFSICTTAVCTVVCTKFSICSCVHML